MKYILYLISITCLLSWSLKAQETKNLIQISGIVITSDSIPQFIPYAHAVVKNGNRGTMTNADGFFSFVALPSDTIIFSVIGFKNEELIIPDSLSQTEYLARVEMRRDTTLLKEVTLYPWPTPDRIQQEFLNARIPSTENDIAMKNLAIQELKARAAEMGYGAEELQDLVIKQHQADIYNFGRYQGYANGGTAILGSLTNPFAWAEFFEAVKRGDFSSK